MPEILRRNGWKIHFYSADRNEPLHVHCNKAEKDCKFFLNEEIKKIRLEYSFKMNNEDISDISKIILDNYAFILEVWKRHISK